MTADDLDSTLGDSYQLHVLTNTRLGIEQVIGLHRTVILVEAGRVGAVRVAVGKRSG